MKALTRSLSLHAYFLPLCFARVVFDPGGRNKLIKLIKANFKWCDHHNEYILYGFVSIPNPSLCDVGSDLRTNPFEEGEDDMSTKSQSQSQRSTDSQLGQPRSQQTIQDPLTLSQGPITRARAKKFKQALQGVVTCHLSDAWNREEERKLADGLGQSKTKERCLNLLSFEGIMEGEGLQQVSTPLEANQVTTLKTSHFGGPSEPGIALSDRICPLMPQGRGEHFAKGS